MVRSCALSESAPRLIEYETVFKILAWRLAILTS